eukprot:XP_012817033.1 PREDICTED: coiled-coil domain-containing protein 17 [Xenopus tropicalis]
MANLDTYRCNNCKMDFRSQRLLEKHKEKFCIGSNIGDPVVLSSRYADGGEILHLDGRGVPRMTESPDFKTSDSIARLRARENLLKEREQQLMDGYGQFESPSDSRALRSLTDEFQKLRKSLQETVPTLRSLQFQGEPNSQIHWERDYRERMQEMAEAHERHLADIHARNQTLELQREDIRQRLSDFTGAGSTTSHLEQMLLELKAQEEKNQLALDALRDQIGLIQSENRTKTETVNKNIPSNTSIQKEKVSFNLIAFPQRGSSLSSEISALQLAYVQSGGNDPSVLVQMQDLQAEALTFEEMAHKQERKEKKKRKNEAAPRLLDAELMAVELENQRLEEEIFNIKIQRGKKKVGNGDSELVEMQREHLQQMAQLQADIELLRRDVSRMPPRVSHGPPPFLPPPVAPPPPPPAHISRHPAGRPDGAVMMGSLDMVRPPSPSANRHVVEPIDALGPAPYDPVAGFVIFYDFLLGLDPTIQKIRLVSGLYSNGQKMGQTTSLPDVLCEVWQSSHHLANAPKGNIAMLSAKQPIPRVRPSFSISLIMELQGSGGFNPYGQEVQQLSPFGWAKFDLFDQHNQVLSGRWKLPVRSFPVRPGLHTGQLNTVPQVGKAEIFFRVINARDAEIQSMAEIDPRNASLYQYPPLMSGPAVAVVNNPAPQPTFHPSLKSFNMPLSHFTDYVDPPPVQELPNQQKDSQSEIPLDGQKELELSKAGNPNSLGFIIDRVKDAPLGDGTLRLTGYHMKTGKVVQTKHKGMNFVISAVSSNIRHGHFIFGEQEVIFGGVTPEEDMLLMLRFYHWPGGSTASAPWEARRAFKPLPPSDEWAAAWAILRLTRAASTEIKDRDYTKKGTYVWNTGTQELALYHSPAPPIMQLSAILPERYNETFEQYGSATVHLCLFSASRPDQAFPSVAPTTDERIQEIPRDVYIPISRMTPVYEHFTSADSIILYIDGARFLPDAVTVTHVTGRIFDRNYEQFGPDISTGVDLNSDIFQPFYNFSLQIQPSNLPPTATLLLKVYTIDRFMQELTLIGWAALNLFVESGTQRAPISDSEDIKVSLNEGAHQIRLYHKAPATDQSFSVESVISSGRVVPCATLLIRVMKVSMKNQQHLQNYNNSQLVKEHPDYEKGVYISDSAQPTQGEIQLYRAMINRSVILGRDVIPSLAGTSDHELNSDKQLSTWVQRTFLYLKNKIPQPFQLCCVSRYIVSSGLMVSADRAYNLPWSGFTLAHICLSPPAAFYFGQPWVKYDHAVPVDDIDLNSDQKCPLWKDGFKSFPERVYHKYLTVIFQLHEILLVKKGKNPETDNKQDYHSAEQSQHELWQGQQAWTALQVFYKQYCNFGIYQLPLYYGVPSKAVLSALASDDCKVTLTDLVKTNTIQLLPGASVTVRIADGRRHGELLVYNLQEKNQMYLPTEAMNSYSEEQSGGKLAELIPDREKEDFKKHLVNWFRKHLSLNNELVHHNNDVEKETRQHTQDTD